MQTHSQACQDIFAYAMLRKKSGIKTYLEPGASHPTLNNNTFMLEKAGWDGASIDIYDYRQQFASDRKNIFIHADTTSLDFPYLIKSKPFFYNTIDYLSFDVDEATEKTFARFPLDLVRFNTITFEHDVYRVGPELRDMVRDNFLRRGYQLVCADVVCPGYGAFEDWWVYPSSDVDMDLVNKITCSNVECGAIASMIQNVVVGGW